MLAPGIPAMASPEGVEALTGLEYQREVLMYCGISDPEAVRGFLSRRDELVAQYDLDEAVRQQAISLARRQAHEEWQNRGLGGFRGWCRGEAMAYTETLKSYAEFPNTPESEVNPGAKQ